jgi:hypothetical protein
VLPISARRLVQVCFLTAVLLLTHRPLGASGDDGWHDHFDRAGGLEEAVAVSIAGNHVIVAGQSANAADNQDWSVFAYDLERGNDD